MILTVTLNPTIDRIYYLPFLEANRVHRGEREVPTPSGKGVDASIIVHLLGEKTLALGFDAGHTGRMHMGMLDDIGVPYDFVEVDGETRTVPVLVDQAKQVEYTITAPTLSASESHFTQVLERITHYAPSSWGLICAGSLPPGLPIDSYAQLLQVARQSGLITLFDVSGQALQAGLAGLPHILKINQIELAAQYPEFTQEAEAIEAGKEVEANISILAQRLMGWLGRLASDAIIISMGIRGALAVTKEGCLYTQALDVVAGVTNGAGDAMDAGIMMARQSGDSWAEAMRLGTAAAAAAVMHDGTAGCTPEDVWHLLPEVYVSQIDA